MTGRFVIRTAQCLSAIFASAALAQGPELDLSKIPAPPAEEIANRVLSAVESWRDAIACSEVAVTDKPVMPLTPYTSEEDRERARYAVLWIGDIGCQGGSGSSSTHIAVVKVGTGDSYVVDPALSSPVVEFQLPVSYVESVVSFTSESLVLQGNVLTAGDARCCPSQPIRFTLRRDARGNWIRSGQLEHLK